MDNKSREHHQEQAPSHSTLTIENVTKLELQYVSVDGDLLERKKVEEYIRKTQKFERQHRNSLSSHSIQQTNSRTGTAKDTCLDGKEKEMQIDSEIEKKCKAPEDANGKKPMINAKICQYKNVQTQTEWSWSALYPAMRRNGLNETEDLHETVSAASSLKSKKLNSLSSKATLESKSVDTVDVDDPGSAEIPLNVEEHSLLDAKEHLASCYFCLKPRKPFPSAEQVISEPSSMLFCCVKSQELFQFLIMDTIKSYTPEDTHGKNEILTKKDQDENEIKEKEFEEKHSDDSESTTPHISDEMKALNSLREELEKVNTKDYITSLSNHVISYG